MSKNDTVTKNLARKAIRAVKQQEVRERTKTSIYVELELWESFRAITAYPRGRTSEILEDFMREYIKLNPKK